MSEPADPWRDACGESAAAAPPTHAGPVSMPKRGVTWPMVVGVLCIVFGGIGVLYALMGLVQSVMFSFVSNAMQAEAASGELPEGLPGSFAGAAVFWAVVWGLELPLAGLQIYAGIQLVQRRARGRGAAIAFSWLDLVLNVLGGVAQYALMSSMMSGMPEGPNAPPPFVPGMFRVFAVVGGAFNAIITSAWPIFLLVWFSRAAVRAEVESWRAGDAPAA